MAPAFSVATLGSHLVPFAHLPSDIPLLITHTPVMLIRGQHEGYPSMYAVPPVGLRLFLSPKSRPCHPTSVI